MELLHRFVEFQENFTGEQFVEWAQAHAEIPVYAVVLYLSFVFSVPEWMKGREPFRLRGCFALWNLFLTVFSWTGVLIVPVVVCVLLTYQHFPNKMGLSFTSSRII